MARTSRPETLVGFLVLGLILAGVFWVRSPSWSARPGSTATAERQPAPAPSAGQAVPVPPTAAASPEEALPDVTVEDARVDLDNIQLTLSVSPRPPVAFSKKRFRVRVTSGGTSAVLEGGRISFEMTMPMGDHRYTLLPDQEGWHEAEVVLPFCKSGNPRWFAIVEGSVDGKPVTARFRVDLTKPSPAA
jgi:hypothetical protein